jgi:hypothetical protein
MKIIEGLKATKAEADPFIRDALLRELASLKLGKVWPPLERRRWSTCAA